MSRLSQARAPSAGAGTLESSPTCEMTAGTTALAVTAEVAGGASSACDRKAAEANASAAASEVAVLMNSRFRGVIGMDWFVSVFERTNEGARPLWQTATS